MKKLTMDFYLEWKTLLLFEQESVVGDKKAKKSTNKEWRTLDLRERISYSLINVLKKVGKDGLRIEDHDEIYEHINYGVPHFSFAKIPSMFNKILGNQIL